jgi:hypothetical protein
VPRRSAQSVVRPAARVLAPLCLAAAAAAISAAPPRPKAPPTAPPSAAGEQSVVPGSPAPRSLPAPQPSSVRPAASLAIGVLRAGAEPYAWAVPGRVAKSFITDTPNTLRVVAFARVAGHPELDSRITWSISPPSGFRAPEGASLGGSRLTVNLDRPEGNPSGGGGPLSFEVRAQVEIDGKTQVASATLTQDARDRLRQEYVDLERAAVPERRELLDEAQFRALYRRRFPNVSFDELNWSQQPGVQERYPVILAAERLVRMLSELRKAYGRPVVVSSGFRNPVRQVLVHAAVSESHHQYGRALDLNVAPDSAWPHTGRGSASESDWLNLAASSVRAGGVWIEPMLACGVNTAACHVHADVRETGARSVLVRLKGRVTDPAGNPVPGASVRLAGMPASTGPDGSYLLKHVLTPQEYELQVQAPGRAPVTQNVTVSETLRPLMVRVPADPLPNLMVRAESAARDSDGLVTVRVAVKNVGLSTAQGVVVAGAAPQLPGVNPQVTPPQLAQLTPGEKTALTLRMAVPTGVRVSRKRRAVPVQLTANFHGPNGVPRSQMLNIVASIPPPDENGAAGQSAPPPATPGPPVTLPKSGVDPGAVAGGLAAGGVAGVATALARKKSATSSAPKPAEPSVDPATVGEPKEP